VLPQAGQVISGGSFAVPGNGIGMRMVSCQLPGFFARDMAV